MFYVVTQIDRLLGYTLRGMARTVLSPTEDPSMSSQTLLHTKNEVYILKIKKNLIMIQRSMYRLTLLVVTTWNL